MTFEKNTSYFFEIVRTNNKIRDILDKYDNVDGIQDEEERDNAISYLVNRGHIFKNKYTGYLKYTRNDFYNSKNSMFVKKCDIELSTDNKRNVFKSIKCLLDKTVRSELQTISCKYKEYYCEEHKIRNHECIDVNEYYHDTDEDEFYNIGYLNYDIYNKYVTNYNNIITITIS